MLDFYCAYLLIRVIIRGIFTGDFEGKSNNLGFLLGRSRQEHQQLAHVYLLGHFFGVGCHSDLQLSHYPLDPLSSPPIPGLSVFLAHDKGCSFLQKGSSSNAEAVRTGTVQPLIISSNFFSRASGTLVSSPLHKFAFYVNFLDDLNLQHWI